MARQKTYALDSVIQDACNVFRKSGYRGTSISDITEGTGLNRKILYDEFIDKAGIFYVAVNFYIAEQSQSWKSCLLRLPLGFDNIENLFRHTAQTMDSRGSLIMLVLDESYQSPINAVEQCTLAINQLTAMIARNLTGRFSPLEAQELAQVLAFQLAALSTRARMGATRSELTSFAKLALSGARLSYNVGITSQQTDKNPKTFGY